MTTAAHGSTKPAAGVIATRPATAPVAAPTVVGTLLRAHSKTIQPSSAAAAPRWVLTNALDASPPEESAEPALKPNQPNHRIAAPVMTIGMLCGCIACFP